MKPIDNKLLEILVCPVTKSPLRYDDENQELISDEAPSLQIIPILQMVSLFY